MKKSLLSFALFVWTGMQVTYAQSRVVKGTVLDVSGDAVIGASVKVKGGNVTVLTDAEGNYEITVPDGSTVLEISSTETGDITQDISKYDGSVLTTKAPKNAQQDLGTVNIYGSKIDKKSYTGSIATITSADIARRPVTDITKALEGAAPGVSVTSGGGQPGASPDIQVRGQNTLSASGAPLIVVDGAPYSGTLASINPMDVESMTVLKDASATSIYGSRASNGVILIMTKRGSRLGSGKPTINLDASVGTLSRQMPLYEILGAKDYLEQAYPAWFSGPGNTGNGTAEEYLVYLGNYNPYKEPLGSISTIEKLGGVNNRKFTIADGAALAYDDNWFDELKRVGIRQNYNLSVSNGDKNSDYFFSLGYVNEQGIVKNSGYDRITTRLNVNSTIAPWLRTGLNLSGSYSKQNAFLTSSQQAYANPFMSAQMMGAIYPVYRYDSLGNKMLDADGNAIYDFGYNTDKNNTTKLDQSRPFATNMNPIAALYNDERSVTSVGGIVNTFIDIKLYKDLTFRTNGIVNYTFNTNKTFNNPMYGDAASVNGRISLTNSALMNYTFNQILTWKPTFADLNPEDGKGHNIEIVAGHEAYAVNNKTNYIQRTGTVSSNFDQAIAFAVAEGSNSYVNEHAIEGYFGMLNYNFSQKYFLSGSLRRDGSSRFSPESRWGTFWSVGAGWSIKDENFLKTVSWINDLKIRGSYGISGNENLVNAGFYASQSTYDFYANGANPGLFFLAWGNPKLRWEGQYKFNIGADFSFFQHRVTGNLDYFNMGANNLLFVRSFPPSTGSSGIYDNVGNMMNSGVELQLNVDAIRPTKADDFGLKFRLNLTHLRNQITKVQEQDSLFGGGTLLTKGLAVNSFFMPEYLGVDPDDGQALYYSASAPNNVTKDYNGLGRADYKLFGNSYRDLEGSFTTTFTYKNFELYFLISFGIGGKFYDGTYAGLMDPQRGEAIHKDMVNSWKQPGDVTDVPKWILDGTNVPAGSLSSRFLVSNSFVNLKSVNLSYSVPRKVLERMKLNTLKVYVSGDNLFYKSARTGLDVQQSFFGSSSFAYFPYKTIMFGLNLGL
jgi:TonB-linked SusC/RagA family outer membrane protein